MGRGGGTRTNLAPNGTWEAVYQARVALTGPVGGEMGMSLIDANGQKRSSVRAVVSIEREDADALGQSQRSQRQINRRVVSKLKVKLLRVPSSVGQSSDELLDVQRPERRAEVVREAVSLERPPGQYMRDSPKKRWEEGGKMGGD